MSDLPDNPFSRPSPLRGSRLWLLQLACLVLAAGIGARIYFSSTRASRLTHESGIWIALATEAAHGVIYRPIIGPLGYGGTRYGPLHFLIQAGLIRAGIAPIPAGFAIVIAATLLMLASLYRLQRILGVPVGLALCLCVLACGSTAAEVALTTIRGDLLAVALNLAGLCVCAPLLVQRSSLDADEIDSGDRRTARPVIAGALFALTVLTKLTSVFGLAAATLVLISRGRRGLRRAGLIVLTFLLVTAAGEAAVQLASHGNYLANLKACASGGARYSTFSELCDVFNTVVISHDPLGLVVLLLGIGALFATRTASSASAAPGERDAANHRGLPLAPVLLLTTAAVTAVLLTSPGIDKNHLLDVQIASLLLLGVRTSQGCISPRFTVGVLTVLAAAAISVAWIGVKGDLPYRTYINRQLADSVTAGKAGPMLSDLSLLPVVQGREPFLLDDYMLPVVSKKFPQVRADLYRRLDEGFFSVVVLKIDPEGDDYRRYVWGPGFMQHLYQGYDRPTWKGGFLIYQRRRPKP